MEKHIVQHPLTIKTLNEGGLGGTYLNAIEALNEKSAANSTVNGEKQNLASKVRDNTRMPTLTTVTQHSPGRSSHNTQKIQGIQAGNEVQLSLFADDMTLCRENPKDPAQNLVELTSEFNTLAEYKINMQKSVAFRCPNDEIAERN